MEKVAGSIILFISFACSMPAAEVPVPAEGVSVRLSALKEQETSPLKLTGISLSYNAGRMLGIVGGDLLFVTAKLNLESLKLDPPTPYSEPPNFRPQVTLPSGQEDIRQVRLLPNGKYCEYGEINLGKAGDFPSGLYVGELGRPVGEKLDWVSLGNEELRLFETAGADDSRIVLGKAVRDRIEVSLIDVQKKIETKFAELVGDHWPICFDFKHDLLVAVKCSRKGLSGGATFEIEIHKSNQTRDTIPFGNGSGLELVSVGNYLVFWEWRNGTILFLDTATWPVQERFRLSLWYLRERDLSDPPLLSGGVQIDQNTFVLLTSNKKILLIEQKKTELSITRIPLVLNEGEGAFTGDAQIVFDQRHEKLYFKFKDLYQVVVKDLLSHVKNTAATIKTK